MTQHKCNTCFYRDFDKDNDFPCKACDNYNAYVNYMAYQPNTTKDIRTWDDQDVFSGRGGGSTLDDYPELKYDVVSKPKHYMLFEDKNIEVRDVIEKLVGKIHDSTTLSTPGYALFEADYVQLMQYLMRFMDKNGAEDLKKARWYLDRMVEAYERSSD